MIKVSERRKPDDELSRDKFLSEKKLVERSQPSS